MNATQIGTGMSVVVLCVIVSPELQLRQNPEEILDLKVMLSVDVSNDVAVCTKSPWQWE